MKKLPLCLLIMTLSHFAGRGTIFAQSAPIPKARAVDVIEETGRVLKDAGVSGRIETEKVSLDRSAGRTRLDQAVEKSQGNQEARTGSAEKAMVDAADRKIDPSLERAAPEGRKLIAQSANTPAMRAPDTAEATANAIKARDVNQEETPAKPGKKEPAEEAPIDIVCQGALYFDSAQSMAVFTEDVVLKHPQFHLTCDELQVYMLKENEKPKETAAIKTTTPAEASKPKQDNSVKQAIATGRKVVIQKRSETGEMQIGIARSATYIGESGDIILRDMPQVQRGRNLIIATDRSTYMILKQNGELKVHGPSRTEIIQEAAKKTPVSATIGDVAPAPKPASVVKSQSSDKPKVAVKKKDKGGKP